MSFMEACQASEDFPLTGLPHSWSIGVFRTFLSNKLGALKRYFMAITTACSTGPTFSVCVFVTCRASGFLFNSEAGFARATSSFTRGLGPLVFLAPYYPDGIGACFQMAACSTGGLIECSEYLRTQASLWSLDGPGIAKESNKQAFREQRVASIVLPTDRRVGLDLFGTPPLDQAWALKATWGEEHEVLYRALKSEGWGRPPFYTSNSYSGTWLACGRVDLFWNPCPMRFTVSLFNPRVSVTALLSISPTCWGIPKS